MTGSKENQQGSAWRFEIAALLVASAGVVVRCLPWRFIFSAEGVVPWGVDPYYHLWRAERLVELFPAVPLTDAFLSFPSGAPVPWPPLFDLLVALPGLLGGGPGTVPVFGALLMPLLGGLAVYLTYRLTSRIFDRATGLAAAALLALLRGSVEFNLLGRVDHHGLVAPVCLGMFLTCLACLRADTPKKRVLWGSACGLLAAFSVGAWVITPPYYFLPIPLTLIWLSLTGGHRSVRPAALAIMTPVVLLVPLLVWLTGDLGARPLALHFPSVLTMLPYFISAAGVALACLKPRWFWPAIGAGGALVLVLVVAAPGLLPESVREVLRLISGRNPIYLLAWESDSLFIHEGRMTLNRPAHLYTHLVLLWPLILGAFVWRRGRDAGSRPAGVLFGLLALWGLGLLMLQERFGEYASPAFAMLLGWGLVSLGRASLQRLRQPGGLRRAGPLTVGLALVTGIGLFPLVGSLIHLAKSDPVGYQRELLRFGRRLKEVTPEPRGPDGLLGYGLLTGWNEANPLRWVSGRPVMVASFSYPEVDRNTRTAFGLLLGRDEEAVYEKLGQLRLDYLVVSPIVKQIESMARTAGLEQRFVRRTPGQSDGGAYMYYQPLAPFFGCLHTRLLLADGSRGSLGGATLESLAHFRLVLESESQSDLLGSRIPTFKAFEVVRGAKITGQAKPGETVQLRLSVQANTGRRFTFRRECRAGPDGRFLLVVPYSTGEGQQPYRIKIGREVTRLPVPEEAVRRGLPVEVSALAATGTTPPSGAVPPPVPPGE